MSKAQGQKIAIRFNNELIGDISGIVASTDERYIAGQDIISRANVSVSSTYTTYVGTYIFDEDISTYWRPATIASWLLMSFSIAKKAVGVKLYTSTSYYPKDFIVEGSNDGVSFTAIGTFTGISFSGWQEFLFINDTMYLHYRISFSTASSTYFRLYGIELKIVVGNEVAFTVTGQQEEHISGDILPIDYQVDAVENASPQNAHVIILVLKKLKRFNNVFGPLTIRYDSSVGSLMDEDSLIDSFVIQFTPTELVKVPNPWQTEHVNVDLSSTFTVTPIVYRYAYGNENIIVSMTASFEVTRLGPNPF